MKKQLIALAAAAALAQGAYAQNTIKVGVVTFLSGPAASPRAGPRTSARAGVRLRFALQQESDA